MLALTLMEPGHRDEAETILRQCIAIGEALASDFPLVPSYRADLAGSYGNLATLLIGMGPDRREEAASVFDKAGRVFQSLVAEYPGVPSYRKDLAGLRGNLGHLFRDAHRWKDAEKSYREAVELVEALVAAEPTNADFKRALTGGKDNLALLLAFRPDLPVYDPARAAGLAREATKLVPEKASSWIVLSLAHYRMGNWKASVDAMERATRLGEGDELDSTDRFVLAMVRWRLGEKDAARALFNHAAAGMAKQEWPDEMNLRLRAEAAALLGLTDHPTPTGKKEENTKQRSTP